MDRRRLQVNIGTLMAVVAFAAVTIAAGPYGAAIIEVAVIWGVYRAAAAHSRRRWEHIGREPTRRERGADNRASCLFVIVFWVGLTFIVNGLRLVWR